MRLAAQLDAMLADTAQDLGLVLDVSEAVTTEPIAELRLPRVAADRGKFTVLPSLRRVARSDELELRLTAAMPDSRVLSTRVKRVGVDELQLRGAVMLRDLVRNVRGRKRPPPVAARRDDDGALAAPARSRGRAMLATNATLYGGFVGFSLQRASDSDDPRLLYPLMAVGAGVGLGSSIIVADEWDVGVGDAWYLAAGAWWPALGGHLVYEGRFGDDPSAGEDERWMFGLIGSVTGLGLATVGLLPRGMGDGGAVLAHSGGGLGMVVGGLGEIVVTGDNDEFPEAGMGYGAAAGWLVGAAVAIPFHPQPSDVLAIDLGALLGGLAGASAASPLIFDDATEGKTRAWAGATAGISDDDDPPPSESSARVAPVGVHRAGLPTPGIIGESRFGRRRVPVMGATWSGTLW
jgi:hypothetical protein